MNFNLPQNLWTVFGFTLAALLASALTAFAAPAKPPNQVAINDRITTSGQPSAEWLADLND